MKGDNTALKNWRAYVAEYRKTNPSVSFKQALVNCSKTYKKKALK